MTHKDLSVGSLLIHEDEVSNVFNTCWLFVGSSKFQIYFLLVLNGGLVIRGVHKTLLDDWFSSKSFILIGIEN